MNRVTRFCLGLLLPLCVLFWSLFSVQVNAEEYPLGTYIYEPYYVPDDYIGTWEIFDFPELYIDAGNSDMPVEIQEHMSVSKMEYSFNYPDGSDLIRGNFDFGIGYGYNHISYGIFTIENSGQPLFENFGTMYLSVWFAGYSGTVSATYSNGVTEHFPLSNDNGVNGTDNYMIIPNNTGQLTKIQLSGTVCPDVGYGTYLGVSFKKYAYILDEQTVPEENHSKNIFELLKNFIDNFSDTIGRALKNAVTSAFQSLFVPDEEYLKSRTELLKTQFWDSMGLLAYPVAFLQSLMDDLADCNPTNAVFTFPCIEWEGVVVIPETDFDLYSFFYGNGFGFLIDACRFFTSVVLVGAFLSFCQDTLRRILDDN